MMDLHREHLEYQKDQMFALFARFESIVKTPGEVDPEWDFDMCAKCSRIVIRQVSALADVQYVSEDPHPRDYWGHGRLCPPCLWYERQFELRLTQWEDQQDWNDRNYYDHHLPQAAEHIGDALWYGHSLRLMRHDYKAIVGELRRAKLEALRQETPQAIVVPRQVPWSWLANTDYGRFRVDDHSEAV